MKSEQVSETDADVIVVGLGALGSSTAWRLAHRGVKVLGIERFSPGHSQGSSHGHSRLFRVACLEHPNLVTMARRSRDLWQELEKQTGRVIFDETGAISIGPASSPVIFGTLHAAAEHDLPIVRVERKDIGRYTSGHENIPDDWEAVWDPEAGVLRPEAGILAAIEAAASAGARILTDTRVLDIRLVDNGVEVTTATNVFRAPQVVVTAGAWLSKLVPGLPLRALRVPMTWFEPREPQDERFQLGSFPVFVRAIDDETAFWGHGSVDGFDAKVGLDGDDNYQWTDADEIERSVSHLDWKHVSEAVAGGVPGLNPEPSRITTCMVTHSPDGQFVIGRPDNDSRLLIGGGDSGHAFKHATGIGELIAQLIQGEEPYVSPDFVDPNRFEPGQVPSADPARMTETLT
ncbi:sarcosine oxidase (plasmid) [Arthrobacter sp. ZXY-2]|uniref:N-methyl-L-tryptophan oxidase n=1 Tax=Paenarthrobacter ureafaciens TaxID=37931 RepID=UPI0008A696D1|nr:sarcosine oxidase [Arthrobacter sp. ZXY-2]